MKAMHLLLLAHDLMSEFLQDLKQRSVVRNTAYKQNKGRTKTNLGKLEELSFPARYTMCSCFSHIIHIFRFFDLHFVCTLFLLVSCCPEVEPCPSVQKRAWKWLRNKGLACLPACQKGSSC